MTISIPEGLAELRSYYGDKYDREDLGVIDKANARPGWKCFSVIDGGYRRDGTGGKCRPLLTGLCADVAYKASVDHARCAGIPAEKYLSPLSPRYGQRHRTDRFTPCRPAPTFGCPARCGLHSNLFMAEARHGMPVAAMALTSSWGQLIRCDSGIGEAWRAQTCRIERLFIAEKFATIRTEGDAGRGFRDRYGSPVEVVPADANTHRTGLQPVASFVTVAEGLGLPALHRP